MIRSRTPQPPRSATALFMLLLALLAHAAAAATPDIPTSTSANYWQPYPTFQVGDTATLIIRTLAIQPNRPVYRSRYRNGVLDHSSEPVGQTDHFGTLQMTIELDAEAVGSYTQEVYRVGSPQATPSNALDYEVHATSPPTVTRGAPFPVYQVGDTASLEITTNPPQPDQPVYRHRLRNGVLQGTGPVATTDATGRLLIEAPLGANEIGVFTEEQFSIGTVGGPRSLAQNFVVHANTAPIAIRALPYPAYRVGDLASLQIITNPSQPDQDIWRYRQRDGQPDGDQPTHLGTTDESGQLTLELVLPSGSEGSFTGERFAVGTPGGPTSNSLAFIIGDSGGGSTAPAAVRAAPYPDYQVGDTATLTIATNPARAHADVWRYRLRDGAPDGSQPTHLGQTGADGRFTLSEVLEPDDVGIYTEERFAIGSAGSLQSEPLAFEVSQGEQAPMVSRFEPYPHYRLGDLDRVRLTTQPLQANEPVYRYRLRDGAADGEQPTLVGYTDQDGVFEDEQPWDNLDLGIYTEEQYTVGGPDGPPSEPLNFRVRSASAPEIERLEPRTVALGEITTVTVHGSNLAGNDVFAVAPNGNPPPTTVVGAALDGSSLEIEIDATSVTDGYYTLAVAGLEEGASTLFRVLDAKPVVDFMTPEEPERGKLYSVVLLGENLQGARVTGSAGIRVFSMNSSANQWTGFLRVTDSAPSGAASLTVQGPGGTTTVPMAVVAGESSGEPPTRNQIWVTEEATRKAAMIGEKVPEIYFQDFAIREDLAVPPVPHKSGIEFSCSLDAWALYTYSYTLAIPFDPITGDIDISILNQLPLGIKIPTGIRLFSAFGRLLVNLTWQCWPPQPPQICIFGEVGFEIPGIGGQILSGQACLGGGGGFQAWLTTTGILGSFSFGTRPANGSSESCSEVEQTTFPIDGGEQIAEVEVTDCCVDELLISTVGTSFPGTPFAMSFSATNFPLIPIVPEPCASDCKPSLRFTNVSTNHNLFPPLSRGEVRNFKLIIRNLSEQSCSYDWEIEQTQQGGGAPVLDVGALTNGPHTVSSGHQASVPARVTVATTTNEAKVNGVVKATVTPQGGSSTEISAEVAVRPDFEVSRFDGWVQDPRVDVARFAASLMPSDLSFEGRWVIESSAFGTEDTCYFAGSAIAEYTDANALSGGCWRIGANNAFKRADFLPAGNHTAFDFIGKQRNIDFYYKTKGRTPCHQQTNQRMAINGTPQTPRACKPFPSSLPLGPYTTNRFFLDVRDNETCISRENATSNPCH